jgi:hypothetical protein
LWSIRHLQVQSKQSQRKRSVATLPKLRLRHLIDIMWGLTLMARWYSVLNLNSASVSGLPMCGHVIWQTESCVSEHWR